jgi:putative oxidoreductase
MDNCRIHKTVSWLFQVIAAAILAQTLFFKFRGSEESKYIFTLLGVEPWGRVVTGCAELGAIVLLLAPRTVTLGALLSLGLMIGAIGSHLVKLGIVVRDDGGLLFSLALTVFMCSAVVLFLRRGQIPLVGAWLVVKNRLDCNGRVRIEEGSAQTVNHSL